MDHEAEFDAVMARTVHAAPSAALSAAECRALWKWLVIVPPGGIVIEAGCQLGRSSSLILGAQRIQNFHSIHIDPYTNQPSVCESWVNTMLQIQEPGLTEFCLCVMRTEQAEWLLSTIGEIDFAFIDGDHLYDGVKKDLQLIGARVKRRGILACHDVGHAHFPGVQQALDEFIDIGWQWIGTFDSLGMWIRK